MTPRQFSKKVRALAEEFHSNAARLPARTALTFVSVVAYATPIDTGKAQGNWQVGIGKPLLRQVHNPARFGAAHAVLIADHKLFNYKGNATIHVTNNLPYIGALDRGHSKQAPKGFIDMAYDATLREINKIRFFKTAGDKLRLTYTEQAHTYD